MLGSLASVKLNLSLASFERSCARISSALSATSASSCTFLARSAAEGIAPNEGSCFCSDQASRERPEEERRVSCGGQGESQRPSGRAEAERPSVRAEGRGRPRAERADRAERGPTHHRHADRDRDRAVT